MLTRIFSAHPTLSCFFAAISAMLEVCLWSNMARLRQPRVNVRTSVPSWWGLGETKPVGAAVGNDDSLRLRFWQRNGVKTVRILPSTLREYRIWPVEIVRPSFDISSIILLFFAVFPCGAGLAAPVDWNALVVAHGDAMQIYNDKKMNARSRATEAAKRLEASNIKGAVEAQIDGISNKKAASILNDYAFILWRGAAFGWSGEGLFDFDPYVGSDVNAAQLSLAESVLRRVLIIDPQRSLAYLNLADVLRSRMRYTDNFKDKQILSKEIEILYRSFLNAGGKSNKKIDNFLAYNLSMETDGNICPILARYASFGRLEELILSGIGIDFGKKKINILFGTEGTAHFPYIHTFDGTTGEELEDVPIETPMGTGDPGEHFALVGYRDQLHILAYRDNRHPIASIAIASKSGCRFSNHVVERVGQKAIEPELCKRLIAGNGPSSIPFVDAAPMTPEKVSEMHHETRIGKMRMLDIATNRNNYNIAEMELSSGAGAGCERKFYDVLDASGTDFASEAIRKLVDKMQDSGEWKTSCGNSPRLFMENGKIYFESKPVDWPPLDEWNTYHIVRRIENDHVLDICDFQIESDLVFTDIK